MIDARRIAVLLATLGATLTPLAACGPKRIAGPSRPGDEMVVLLPDAETGSVGHASVSNASGTADLNGSRDATEIATNQPPTQITTLSEGDVKRIFGSALSALPKPPRRFTLNFLFESDDLTPAARALVPEIVKAVKGRPVPDIVIVGHTDTMGTPEKNFDLGLKRATTVRDLLVAAGLDTSFIDVTSHGEGDLLVQTADETPEPRNRRVEIAVR